MQGTAVRRALTLASVAAAMAAAWAVSPPAAHAATGCAASNDFDGDGRVDAAVGAPGGSGRPGFVEVRLSGADGTRAVEVAEPGGHGGDRFGAAVAEVADHHAGDSRSRCSLLAVGAPGRDVGGVRDAGAVFLFAYDRSEGAFALLNELHQGADGVPGNPQAGAGFGSVLASRDHGAGATDPVVRPLYAGIPGATVGGHAAAGAFARLTFTGADVPTVDQGTLVSQDSTGVPGTAETGDRFGASLAVLEDFGVAAGAPGEAIGSAAGAGGVVLWYERNPDLNRFLSQDTAGFPGTAEAGDHFGAALYSALETMSDDDGSFHLLLGVPGEDIGSARDAGAACDVDVDFSEIDWPTGVNQNTPGVAGTVESGDRFGSSFATVGVENGYLVGVPGEDVGDVEDAGMVETVGDGRSWSEQAAGVPGRAEAGDGFGAVLGNAAVPMDHDAGPDAWLEAVTVGVPGEDSGAGAVVAGLPGGSRAPQEWKQASPSAGDGYGYALGRTN
ncbi:MAG TPA: hypothetical protein VF053_04520 [Streptosporangiales bacterium]